MNRISHKHTIPYIYKPTNQNNNMKLTKQIAALSALTFCTTAYGDVTVDITGATAFRAAALTAIRSKYNDSGVAYQFAHDQASGAYSGATRTIFKGSFPGIAGVTTIRTSFNGSVEGIRALVDSPASDPTYYTDISGNLVTAAVTGGGETHKDTAGFTKTAVASQSEIAFSDVSKAATPYSGYSLQPSASTCGVVVFTMLTNEGSPVTNVTSQQFRALMSNGFLPRSVFSGVAADNPDGDAPGPNAGLVFATGRNDGSGTRTTYLAETGYGVANAVKQYVTNVSTATALTTIQLVPAGGIVDQDPMTAGIQGLPGQLADNKSTVWSNDIAGNGGYSSGSTLRTDMGKTGAAVTVLDEYGDDAFGVPVKADLVTWLSLNDAITARGNGAIFCSFNGVKLNDIAVSGSIMSATDRAKVTEGAYTAWGFQQLYRRNDITSGDAVTVYTGIKTALENPANLGAAGITTTEMHAGRPFDGGTVAP
jgi:hypothetical protein